MNSSALPTWLEYVRVLGAPIVALLAAVVAGIYARAQWHTARQKLIIDLFERRYAAYREIASSFSNHMIHGIENVKRNNPFEFGRAIGPAKFLFGPEVYEFLEKTDSRLSRSFRLEKSSKLSEGILNRIAEGQSDYLDSQLSSFYRDFDKLVEPYLLLDQKRP